MACCLGEHLAELVIDAWEVQCVARELRREAVPQPRTAQHCVLAMPHLDR